MPGSNCYASVLGGCDGGQSREHYISATVLEQLEDLQVSGLARTPPGSYPVKALTAKILCREHNSALSGLDATAGTTFRILREMQTSLNDDRTPAPPREEQVSGVDLERWLLKVALGMIAAGQWGINGGITTVNTVRGDSHTRLVKVLFGRHLLWPPRWGMYWGAAAGEQFHALRDEDGALVELGMEPLTHSDDHALWGLRLWMRSLRLQLALGRPDQLPPGNYRPRSLTLQRPDAGHAPQTLRLWWPKDGYSHKDLQITRIGTLR